jgi:hypothetical protein
MVCACGAPPLLVIRLTKRVWKAKVLRSRNKMAGIQAVKRLTTASAPKKATSKDICYHCKQPGHWKVDCPLLKA